MKRISIIMLSAALAAACGNDPGGGGGGDDSPGDDAPEQDEWDKELAKRQYDYNAALRIAALRLTGDIPTMTEIRQVSDAGDLEAQRVQYELLVQQYMTRPTFAREMRNFWRDTFKMGETAEMDTAPTFAAMLSVQNGDYTQLLKAATGACPTLNEQTGEFTVADCTGPGPKVGVLSNQGVMKQYYGNFGFRRVKWVQETFDCAKFPVKNDAPPVDIGGAVPYTGYFPIETIANLSNGGRVNFTEAVAVNCANCHGVMNHRAPLFVNFDMNGVYQNQIAVRTPLPMEPLAQLTDLLPTGEGPAWVFGVPTPDLPALGNAMAADPGIARCGVARIWNWAMGKADIVELLTEVPIETIQTQVDEFTQSGFKMKDMIYKAFTHADFVQF